MQSKTIVATIIITILLIAQGCVRDCSCDGIRRSVIYLKVIDRNGDNLLNQNNALHYNYDSIRHFFIDEAGTMRKITSADSTRFIDSLMLVNLYPEAAVKGITTIIIQWNNSGSEDRDTIQAIWERANPYALKELYLNSKQLPYNGGSMEIFTIIKELANKN